MEGSSAEAKVILEIKRRQSITLEDAANILGMSKMGAYKHLLKLERRGLVARRIVKKNVGRPIHAFHLTDKGRQYFGSADSIILVNLLEFLKDRGEGELIKMFLRERYARLMEQYHETLSTREFEDKVTLLSELRTQEGYMAELKKTGKGFELVEYNCPILKVASFFGEACNLEAHLFSSLLEAEVNNTHRQVDGCDMCRFVIKPRQA
jgi:predicted ArsR family transcriptional regulator